MATRRLVTASASTCVPPSRTPSCTLCVCAAVDYEIACTSVGIFPVCGCPALVSCFGVNDPTGPICVCPQPCVGGAARRYEPGTTTSTGGAGPRLSPQQSVCVSVKYILVIHSCNASGQAVKQCKLRKLKLVPVFRCGAGSKSVHVTQGGSNVSSCCTKSPSSPSHTRGALSSMLHLHIPPIACSSRLPTLRMQLQ